MKEDLTEILNRYSVKLNSGYRYITTAYRISNLTGTQLLKIPRMHIASGKEAAIIETAMLLHNSRYKGNASLENVLALLGDMTEKDFYQTEFEQLIRELQGSR